MAQKNATVDATCKANSCGAETATIVLYKGSTRTVECDGCGRQFSVPKADITGGPYTEQ